MFHPFPFRQAFPALSGSNIKHKELREQFIPRKSGLAKFKSGCPFPIKETWTHEFCCVPFTFQTTTPSYEQLELLRNAGLGKKKLVFKNKDAGHDEVCKQLKMEYPQLESVGGFILQRAKSNWSINLRKHSAHFMPDSFKCTNFSTNFMRTKLSLFSLLSI